MENKATAMAGCDLTAVKSYVSKPRKILIDGCASSRVSGFAAVRE
jgi:hypothetical protein